MCLKNVCSRFIWALQKFQLRQLKNISIAHTCQIPDGKIKQYYLHWEETLSLLTQQTGRHLAYSVQDWANQTVFIEVFILVWYSLVKDCQVCHSGNFVEYEMQNGVRSNFKWKLFLQLFLFLLVGQISMFHCSIKTL